MRKYEIKFYRTLSDFRKGIESLKTTIVEAYSFEGAEKNFKAKFGKPYMIFSIFLIPLKSDNQRPIN